MMAEILGRIGLVLVGTSLGFILSSIIVGPSNTHFDSTFLGFIVSFCLGALFTLLADYTKKGNKK